MFIQIHMLQSMPPGNLNRDDNGQPKKCLFGGVTRSRISSQCLKRNIRQSQTFKDAFGNDLAKRTTYLPSMIADILKENKEAALDDGECNKIMQKIAKKFVKEEKNKASQQKDEPVEEKSKDFGQTPQLVFFPPAFSQDIAEIILAFRSEDQEAYSYWLDGFKEADKNKDKSVKDKEEKYKKIIKSVEKEIFEKSKKITTDIALFGRMTTSDLVADVNPACQVAHAMGTHEVLIESDYFTAIDDSKKDFVETQTELAGAAFLGSGETQTFFDSSVYYKYFNLDLDALNVEMKCDDECLADAAATFFEAAVLGTPTGKQNSFAAHGLPEMILVEASKTKRPISYANAFLEPVEGRNLMTESANALAIYVNTVGKAYAPEDVVRMQLALGSASEVRVDKAKAVTSLNAMKKGFYDIVGGTTNAEG